MNALIFVFIPTSVMSTIKRIKLLHKFYNLLNYKKLQYLSILYKKLGLRKKFYDSISSNDFPEDSLEDHPWLDIEDSEQVFPVNPTYRGLSTEYQKALLKWTNEGYALINNFYTDENVETINQLLQKLLNEKKLPIKDNRKIMHSVRISKEMRNLVNTPELTRILKLLMGREVDLFQSVNFLKGSEDPTHSDFIHMSTYPYGYLIAVWIALEEITLENGPLYYYPKSHKLPYTMNKDFQHGGNSWFTGKNYKKRYAEKINNIIAEKNFEKRVFTAAKGDVLIWHANLLHGGSPILDNSITRKSMVMHYFGKDVIRYHEISERPSLLEE